MSGEGRLRPGGAYSDTDCRRPDGCSHVGHLQEVLRGVEVEVVIFTPAAGASVDNATAIMPALRGARGKVGTWRSESVPRGLKKKLWEISVR